MHIRQLNLDNPGDVAQFIRFPFALYRRCPLWVPPLLSSARETLNRRKHPFYHHSSADFFVVEDQGRTLGRIAALENRPYNAYRGSQTAFFGYFEVIDSLEVARLLLAAACDWAKARGLTEIIGPRGVIGVDGTVLVEGFEYRPALGIPYNFPYYDAFIQDSGFGQDADYLSGYRSIEPRLPDRFERIAERLRRRHKLRVKGFRRKAELQRWIPRLIELHHQAFGQLHSYYPPSEAELKLMIKTLLSIADPRLIQLVLKEEEIVGFLFAYPDLSRGLQKAAGRLWPWGWSHLLRERRRTNWLAISAVGLLPAYRGSGANILLYLALQQAARALNYDHLEMIQIEARNVNSRADMEHLGVTWIKRHRHYRRSI